MLCNATLSSHQLLFVEWIILVQNRKIYIFTWVNKDEWQQALFLEICLHLSPYFVLVCMRLRICSESRFSSCVSKLYLLLPPWGEHMHSAAYGAVWHYGWIRLFIVSRMFIASLATYLLQFKLMTDEGRGKAYYLGLGGRFSLAQGRKGGGWHYCLALAVSICFPALAAQVGIDSYWCCCGRCWTSAGVDILCVKLRQLSNFRCPGRNQT